MAKKMSTAIALNIAIELVGLGEIANELGISYQAIKRWEKIDRLPDSEYSCRTSYALKIQELTKRKVTVKMLLGHTPACIAINRRKGK